MRGTDYTVRFLRYNGQEDHDRLKSEWDSISPEWEADHSRAFSTYRIDKALTDAGEAQ